MECRLEALAAAVANDVACVKLNALLILLARPVLNRFGQVHRLDALTAGQVGHGARQLEDAVIGARAEL